MYKVGAVINVPTLTANWYLKLGVVDKYIEQPKKKTKSK